MENTNTRIGMPLEDFLEEANRHPFELINSERKPILPGVAGPNYVMNLLYRALLAFLFEAKIGEVFMEATFILPDRDDGNWVIGSRTPDILFFATEGYQQYIAATPDWKTCLYALIPDLVVEVVSPTDRYSDLEEKVEAYLQDRVRLIWVIDPQRRKANVYQDGQLIRLDSDAMLDGADVLPGFQFPLTQLFA